MTKTTKTKTVKPKAKTQAKTEKPKTAEKKPQPKAKAEKQPRKSDVKERFINMLKRPDGATDAEMVAEFGWKGPHVSRGRRSNLAKEMATKNSPYLISKFTRTPSGETAYKIEAKEEEKAQEAA